MIDTSLISHNLPVLQVVIPMMAAAVCAVFKSGNKAWYVATIATWGSVISTVFLYSIFKEQGEIRLAIGGHEAPIGIEYRIDSLNLIVLLLVSFVGALILPYAKKSVEKEISKSKQPMFYTMYLLCFAGLMGIASTNDIFNIYVFIEISSLATYTLIALGKDRKALTASYEYLILGTVGATFFLIGIGFIYIMTGTLNISDIAARISDVDDMRPIEVAFAFIILGLGMKMALFPTHIWLTDSYAYAPSVVSAFLSATATKVMVYVFIRCLYTMFGYELSFNLMPSSDIVLILGVIGILVGSLTAIYQPNVKRMLAFSSVAQLGYIILAIGLATETGLTAAIVHLANHALAKSLLFLALGCIFYRIGSTRLTDMKGIAKDMPITMTFFIIGALSLLGIPGTAGFISKWFFFMALIEKDMWYLVIVLIASSIFAVMYIWKVIDTAFFGIRHDGITTVNEAPNLMLLVMLVFAIANIYFGFDTSMTLDLAKDAAHDLFMGNAK